MIRDRVIIRTSSNLSYTGNIIENKKIIIENEGILLKPSDKSNILIWIPVDELDSVIGPNGVIKKGSEFQNGF